MRRSRFTVVLILAGMVSASVPASASEKPLELENFSERLSKDVPVSGRMLVGAMVLGQAGAVTNLSPRLLWRGAAVEWSEKVPDKAPEKAICVTFASRDGQYYGEGEVSAARLAALAGPQRVVGGYSRETVGHLRSLAADDLAMLATQGECRVGADGTKLYKVYVLDRRDPLTPGPAKLRVNLNSLNYTLGVEVALAGGTRQAMACTRLEGAQRNKAYNTQCEVALPAQAAEAELFIQRRRHERSFSELSFRLLWAQP